VNIEAIRPSPPKASVTVWCLAGTLLVVCVVVNVLWW